MKYRDRYHVSRKLKFFAAALGVGALLLAVICGRIADAADAGNLTAALGTELSKAAQESVLPILVWNPEENPKAWLYKASVESILPVCAMAWQAEVTGTDKYADVLTYDEISEKAQTYPENGNKAGNGAKETEETVNDKDQSPSGTNQASDDADQVPGGTGEAWGGADGMRDKTKSAQSGFPGDGTEFVPHEKVRDIAPDKYDTFEELVKNFYTVDAGTKTGADELNAKLFLERDLSVEKTGDGPQILIYHTHSMETYDAAAENYADGSGGYAGNSVVEVGDRLAEILRERYGYQVLHCTESFDKESRDEAYGRALPVITRILEENPSIQVLIDLHRDQMPVGQHLVTDIDGRPTARFMFFNGLSRTKKNGDITYLKNENLSGNLAFSFQMQMKCEEYYPGLTRKIYLKGYRYNMHLKPRSLLVELGAQNNTVREAMNACDPLAHTLDMVLSGQ